MHGIPTSWDLDIAQNSNAMAIFPSANAGSDDYSHMGRLFKPETIECEQCGEDVETDKISLMSVVCPDKTVEMQVCDHCAKPVNLEVVELGGGFYIQYIDGLGSKRKVIEAWGETKEKAVEEFRAQWVEKMNRDLVNYVLK